MDPFYPQEVATGQIITPRENLKAPWFGDDALLTFGDGKDATISYDDAMDKLYFNNTPIYLEEAVTFGQGTLAVWPGTATRIAVGSFIDTAYGLKNSTSNKAQINLSPDMGLGFDTGSRLGALKIITGHGIDVGASGIEVDPDDIRDPLTGLVETTSNHLGVNLSGTSGLAFDTGAKLGALTLKTGVVKRVLASGTASAAAVTVSGIAAGDELISVVAYTNATVISSMADRTAEYVIGTGQLTKTAGTNETGNQLDIMYLDRT
jgi:hypothetical protein